MSACSFISLVPPGSGGVRDYASMIQSALGAPVMELSRATDTAALGGDCVLLHFSGYGYQKRGVPLWLIDKVQGLRARSKTIGIVFHELFALAEPPWRSAFWLSALQGRIARKLLDLSDFWLTNREQAGRWLLDQGHPVPHRVLPVFSNVGEPPFAETARRPIVAVFGSASVRGNVYRWNDGEIFRSAKRLGLQIHDIGPRSGDEVLNSRLAAEGVIERGKLPAEEVSLALSQASFGAVAYQTAFVAKSGVFAAYCAHGTCPVLLAKEYDPHAGLNAGQHYVAGFAALESQVDDAAAIRRAAHGWYQPHRVEAHAAALAAMSAEARNEPRGRPEGERGALLRGGT